MTNSFRDKVGQGGYGGVFKGKLADGRLVAVKVLNESKGNGEEFINEVASISRTSHVNVVSFLGFCFDGSKRALIYEFMSNGSLEKFIYKKCPHLGWERLYQIAIGIAKGLEYLHRGCNTRILHFDIKPHNILLDDDFCPKISDFGLAKLCPTKDSIISMADTRGTIGYIAPEVFSRYYGGVSHKSDVYSYGMMVLEMVGGRKNFDAGVGHTSENYFPDWIYKHIEQDEHLQLDLIFKEKEEEIARKMAIVGLCQRACPLELTQVAGSYPFSKDTKWECGLGIIRCVDNSTPQLINSEDDPDRFEVTDINYTERVIKVDDLKFMNLIQQNRYLSFHTFYHGKPPSPSPSPSPPDDSQYACNEVDDILNWLSWGFDLQWNLPQQCHQCDESSTLCLTAIVSSFIFAITLMATLVCYLSRKVSSDRNTQNVKDFLRDYGSLAPRRYSYSDIKKITNSFKEKLGQGGYVAVKVLNHFKGNGEELINEVASTSRTSHVNVVGLLGFCFDGSIRALIYEFLSNGSLEKFIYKTCPHLGWERLYQVAIGIAKGLEYLHRGCKTRILHFDIKPHDILLDEDFCPKISDFALAKLCLRKNSIISMADARGTIGYIAPKVFSRNIGRVSHKLDVYSYEMVGGRRQNIDVGVDHTNEIYLPHWIYKHIGQGEHLRLDTVQREEEEEIARKMVLVGLWCIQVDPTN
ncbi:hypothetical protein NE237_005834 [Protea cynaroides]|uniref:non-specific serine/threonine protein kinase n=1 Tax=Protea cynaroides TaxID=273540 RepID=A0A9Q0QUV6_9MAGN|nr:hypothetical protein NE237_005834 [Protea cynaroides]